MANKNTHNSPSWGKMIWIGVALLMLGGAVYAGIYFEQNTRITAVEFTGNEFTPDDQLSVSFPSPVGMLADSIQFDELFSSLQTLPYVKNSSVRMSFRGTLTVEVDERMPIGLLAGSSPSYFDEEGIILPADAGKSVDVPIVYGFRATAPGDTLSATGFQQVKEFLIASKEDSFGWSSISEVAWNEAEGVVALSSENGVKLLFGRNEFDQKVNHWKAFYKDVVSYRGINSFRSVDLRFRNQIVTDEI